MPPRASHPPRCAWFDGGATPVNEPFLLRACLVCVEIQTLTQRMFVGAQARSVKMAAARDTGVQMTAVVNKARVNRFDDNVRHVAVAEETKLNRSVSLRCLSQHVADPDFGIEDDWKTARS